MQTLQVLVCFVTIILPPLWRVGRKKIARVMRDSVGRLGWAVSHVFLENSKKFRVHMSVYRAFQGNIPQASLQLPIRHVLRARRFRTRPMLAQTSATAAAMLATPLAVFLGNFALLALLERLKTRAEQCRAFFVLILSMVPLHHKPLACLAQKTLNLGLEVLD